MSTTTTRPTPDSSHDASEPEETFGLDFQHVTKRYKGESVVSDLSFTVHPGRDQAGCRVMGNMGGPTRMGTDASTSKPSRS